MLPYILAFMLVAVTGVRVYAAKVDLQWDYTTGPTPQTGFLVQRAQGQCQNFATLPNGTLANPAARAFTDTTVANGQTYCYQVLATSAEGGNSAPSNVVTFQVPALPPNAPTTLRGAVTP